MFSMRKAGSARRPAGTARLSAILALILLLPGVPALAQTLRADSEMKVWVRLKDKGPASRPFDRASRAYENLPVHEPYLAALAAEGFSCDTRLKWQNRVSGYIPRSRLPRLMALGFVGGVSELPRKAVRPRPPVPAPWIPSFLAKPSAAQTIPDPGVFRSLADTLGITKVLQWMDQEGIKPGKGVRIAVMDADFDLGHAAFDRLRLENRIKDQWDFVGDKALAVTSSFGDSHGAQCLSLIGGSLPGKIVASVPEADFLLYRTEDSDHERYAEEDFLAAAIERAVDSGAQVISISVVYRTQFDSTPDIPLSQMDGRTRPSSVAALGAARRNVLLVAAMGNMDGIQSGPSTLSVPADADSILAVGIVNRSGTLCGYSTTGPTTDGRIKPELVSMGLAGSCSVEMAGTLTREGIDASQGTSFAAPVVAGLAALLRQAQPEKSAQEIRNALLATARNAASPNSQIGWGLPDALKALARFRPEVSVRPVARIPAAPAAGGLHDALGRRMPEPGTAGARLRRHPSLVFPSRP